RSLLFRGLNKTVISFFYFFVCNFSCVYFFCNILFIEQLLTKLAFHIVQCETCLLQSVIHCFFRFKLAFKVFHALLDCFFISCIAFFCSILQNHFIAHQYVHCLFFYKLSCFARCPVALSC